MAPEEKPSSRKTKRQRNRRRTDPDNISSPSSSSPSSSDSEVASTSRQQAKEAVQSDKSSALPTKMPEKITRRIQKDPPKSAKRKRDSADAAAAPSADRQARRSDSISDKGNGEALNGKLAESSSPQSDGSMSEPPDSVAPRQQPHRPSINAEFETWYLRAVTSQYGNDLDKLRTEAADFKARPREAVTVLSKALRQGVSVFAEEERKIVVGGGNAGGKNSILGGKA